MILPNKHLKLSNSILNTGAVLLELLNDEQTVTLLWDKVRTNPEIRSFDRFTLGLDLLFTIGLIDFNGEGLVERTKQ